MIRSFATALALLWAAPVVTEKVDVRDRGTVDLAPFACTDTPRSTVVERVCYDRASHHLLIRTRGSYRDYCGVSAATFNAFIVAPSMGQFYAQNIRSPDAEGPLGCGTRARTNQTVPSRREAFEAS